MIELGPWSVLVELPERIKQYFFFFQKGGRDKTGFNPTRNVLQDLCKTMQDLTEKRSKILTRVLFLQESFKILQELLN